MPDGPPSRSSCHSYTIYDYWNSYAVAMCTPTARTRSRHTSTVLAQVKRAQPPPVAPWQRAACCAVCLARAKRFGHSIAIAGAERSQRAWLAHDRCRGRCHSRVLRDQSDPRCRPQPHEPLPEGCLPPGSCPARRNPSPPLSPAPPDHRVPATGLHCRQRRLRLRPALQLVGHRTACATR